MTGQKAALCLMMALGGCVAGDGAAPPVTQSGTRAETVLATAGPIAGSANVQVTSARGWHCQGQFLPDAAQGEYPLVLANILATPLKLLAPLLAAHLAPGAHLVLAGLRSGRSLAAYATAAERSLPRVPLARIALWRRAALLRLAMIYALTAEPRATITALIDEAA